MSTSNAKIDSTGRIVLAIAILASFISFLDGSVVQVALPAITNSVGGGLVVQQWLVDSYLITMSALLLIAGALSDTYGRMRVLVWGLVGFAITSVGVGLAPNAELLIVFRALQGVAGALLVPSSLALITQYTSGAATARAIGWWTSLTSAAMLVAPLVGGILSDIGWWRCIFFINLLPIAVALLLVRLSGIRETSKVSGSAKHIDVVSALLCAVGLAGCVFGLVEAGHQGSLDLAAGVAIVAGVVFLVFFVVRQATIPNPILSLNLFRVGNVLWGNVATVFFYAVLNVFNLVLVLFLQMQAHWPAAVAGLSLLPTTLIMMAGSGTAGRLSGVVGPRAMMTVGPILAGLGLLLTLGTTETVNYWTQLLPGVLLYGIGMTATVSPLTSTVLSDIDVSMSGAASALNNAIARIAGLVAIASVGFILGGPMSTSGLHRTMIIGAVLMIAAAAASFIGVRRPANQRK